MLAELPEAQATGRDAEIYDAIRKSQGVGMVSMVYRHTAVDPARRDWAWRIVGPEFTSGRFAEAASSLCRDAVVEFLHPRLAKVPAPPDLGSEINQQAVDVGDAFNRANPMNYLYGSIIVRLLQDETPAGSGDVAEAGTDVERSLESEIRALPPIMTMDAMPPRIRDRIQELSDMGVGKHDKIIPSYFRHLAHAPDYIDYIYDALTADGAWDLIEQASDRFRAGAEATVESLLERCAPRDTAAGRPRGQAREDFAASLATFQPRNGIMIGIGNLLVLKHQG